jgi:hypothetical protein
MNLIRRGGLWLLISVCSAGQAQTDSQTTEQLMRQSGLAEQVQITAKAFTDNALSETESSRSSLSASERERIRKRLEQAFDPIHAKPGGGRDGP